jgi:hypothetical protein
MRFTVPQFIEHEPKIVGPLTFRQFMYIGMAAAICFVVYFTASFTIFVLTVMVVGGLGFAFAFIKIDGRSLTTLLINFLKYILSPKMYLWRKKDEAVKIMEEMEVKSKEVPEDEIPLKIGGKSRLKSIKTQIDTTQ